MSQKELKKILFAEDEADIRAVAEIALQSVGGFELKVCDSGDEALACAEEFAPDLLLFDVMMPGLDGPSTLKEIRKNPSLSETPAIFMTAKVQPQEIEQFKALGALDVISKPFDPMGLADQIKTIWSAHVK